MMNKKYWLCIVLASIIFNQAMDNISDSLPQVAVFDTKAQLSLLTGLIKGTYIPLEDGLVVSDCDYGEQNLKISFEDLRVAVQEIDQTMNKYTDNQKRLRYLMRHSTLFFPDYQRILKEEKDSPLIASSRSISEAIRYLRYTQSDEYRINPLLCFFFTCADQSFVEIKSKGKKPRKECSPHYITLAKKYEIYQPKLGRLLANGRLKRMELIEKEANQKVSADILAVIEQLLATPKMHLTGEECYTIEQDIKTAFKMARDIDEPYEEIITTPETNQIRMFIGIAE